TATTEQSTSGQSIGLACANSRITLPRPTVASGRAAAAFAWRAAGGPRFALGVVEEAGATGAGVGDVGPGSPAGRADAQATPPTGASQRRARRRDQAISGSSPPWGCRTAFASAHGRAPHRRGDRRFYPTHRPCQSNHSWPMAFDGTDGGEESTADDA